MGIASRSNFHFGYVNEDENLECDLCIDQPDCKNFGDKITEPRGSVWKIVKG